MCPLGPQVLEDDHYQAWLKGQLLAETSIENREELLLESALRLETHLTLLGESGVWRPTSLCWVSLESVDPPHSAG